jgi:hypothetical protein
MKLILIFLFFPFIALTQAIETLIDSSDLVIEAKVVSLIFHGNEYQCNSSAKVVIKKVYKGYWSKDTINIAYNQSQFHTKIRFTEEELFIAFLKISDSTVEVLNNHNGKFDFGSEISEGFPEFLSDYIDIKSKKDRLKILFDFIDNEPNISILSKDILNFKKLLNNAQQQKLLDAVIKNTTLLIKCSPDRHKLSCYRQYFELQDYDIFLFSLKQRKVRNQAIDFLKYRLTITTSNSIARHTLGVMSAIAVKHKKKMKKMIEDYDGRFHSRDQDEEIDAELMKIIHSFNK